MRDPHFLESTEGETSQDSERKRARNDLTDSRAQKKGKLGQRTEAGARETLTDWKGQRQGLGQGKKRERASK